MWQLISIPQVNISLLPLSIPKADGLNNGGYKIPFYSGNWKITSKEEYSPIDLLVAGLEAKRRNIIITSLVSFFDQNRNILSSETEIYLTLHSTHCVECLGQILTKNIAWIKCFNDLELNKIMLRNAPLTFKWR